MSSKLTQIALNFGEEPQQPPVPSAGGNGVGAGNGAGVANGGAEDTTRAYHAAGGVGVRVKSYKQQPAPQESPGAGPGPEPEIASRPAARIVNGDLFGVQESPVPAALTEEGSGGSEEPVGAVPEEPVGTVPEEPVGTVPEEAVGTVSEAPAVAEKDEPASTLNEEPLVPLPSPRRRTPPGQTTAAKPGPSKRGRKSLKEVAAEAQLIEIPTDEVLFSKQYYTMGEVSQMFRVNQSLLRFWETEFDILQPKKNKKGDRYFRPVDIKNLHLIYHLLRQKKYTIEGAKEFLKKNKRAEERFAVIQRLEQIKAFLMELRAQL